ncbi:MAG: HD family hydrolase [Haloferacaceae archaeon]
MDAPPSAAELDALLAALELKDERRTGWDLRGVDDPETVAAHTWGVAYLCLLYADRVGGRVDGEGDGPPPEDATVDRDRALRMAVLHDVAEAETGDVATRADSTAETPDPAAKERRERAAMGSLLGPFSDEPELRDLWEEYEARETLTAAFVKDMDLVDMCLQALYYERAERYEPGESDAFAEYDRLDEFFATAEPRLRTDVGHALYRAIRERYERVRDERGHPGDDRDHSGDAATDDTDDAATHDLATDDTDRGT